MLNENFFQNKKAFLASALQVAIILMMAAIAFRQFISETAFYAIETVLAAIFLRVLFFDLKKETKKEHKYSVYFFAPLLVLVQLAWIAQKMFQAESIAYFIAVLAAFFLFIAAYKLLFGRNYTPATVLLSNDKMAVVETGYDIRSFATAQRHIVETGTKLPEGKEVKISIKKGFFGKKTAKMI